MFLFSSRNRASIWLWTSMTRSIVPPTLLYMTSANLKSCLKVPCCSQISHHVITCLFSLGPLRNRGSYRQSVKDPMCSDGLDSWFASLPLFGEVSEKNWERLDLDYDMEVGRLEQPKKTGKIVWCLLFLCHHVFVKQKNALTTPASETCQTVFSWRQAQEIWWWYPLCVQQLYIVLRSFLWATCADGCLGDGWPKGVWIVPMDCHNGRAVDKSDNLWITFLVAMGYSLYIELDSSSQESRMIQQLVLPVVLMKMVPKVLRHTHTQAKRRTHKYGKYIYILYTVYIYIIYVHKSWV